MMIHSSFSILCVLSFRITEKFLLLDDWPLHSVAIFVMMDEACFRKTYSRGCFIWSENISVWTKRKSLDKISSPPEGSRHTPPHQSCDFRWKDYFPMVFRLVIETFLFSVLCVIYLLLILCMITSFLALINAWMFHRLFWVDTADCILSICENDTLQEL